MVLDQFAHIARNQYQAISDLYKWMFGQKPSKKMVNIYKKGGGDGDLQKGRGGGQVKKRDRKDSRHAEGLVEKVLAEA